MKPEPPKTTALRGTWSLSTETIRSLALEVPLICARDAVLQLDLRFPTERLGAGDVHEFAWSAVRLGRVPADLAREGAQVADDPDQLADLDLLPRANVDRLRLVVVLRRQGNRLGRVLDVEELARSRAGTG